MSLAEKYDRYRAANSLPTDKPLLAEKYDQWRQTRPEEYQNQKLSARLPGRKSWFSPRKSALPPRYLPYRPPKGRVPYLEELRASPIRKVRYSPSKVRPNRFFKVLDESPHRATPRRTGQVATSQRWLFPKIKGFFSTLAGQAGEFDELSRSAKEVLQLKKDEAGKDEKRVAFASPDAWRSKGITGSAFVSTPKKQKLDVGEEDPVDAAVRANSELRKRQELAQRVAQAMDQLEEERKRASDDREEYLQEMERQRREHREEVLRLQDEYETRIERLHGQIEEMEGEMRQKEGQWRRSKENEVREWVMKEHESFLVQQGRAQEELERERREVARERQDVERERRETERKRQEVEKEREQLRIDRIRLEKEREGWLEQLEQEQYGGASSWKEDHQKEAKWTSGYGETAGARWASPVPVSGPDFDTETLLPDTVSKFSDPELERLVERDGIIRGNIDASVVQFRQFCEDLNETVMRIMTKSCQTQEDLRFVESIEHAQELLDAVENTVPNASLSSFQRLLDLFEEGVFDVDVAKLPELLHDFHLLKKTLQRKFSDHLAQQRHLDNKIGLIPPVTPGTLVEHALRQYGERAQVLRDLADVNRMLIQTKQLISAVSLRRQ